MGKGFGEKKVCVTLNCDTLKARRIEQSSHDLYNDSIAYLGVLDEWLLLKRIPSIRFFSIPI